MLDKKIEKYLLLAERFISLIKPKFHNSITRVVVVFGLTLAVESQVNIFEAFFVAGYESLFGSSEYLRSIFVGSSNPWLGIAFVALGLIYNAVITVGLELIQSYKKIIPKEPELEFVLLNNEMKPMADSFNLKGSVCTHSIEDIPDNYSYSEYAQKRIDKNSINVGVGVPIMLKHHSFSDPDVNNDFYRERAEFLRVWGGAEIIKLSISNNGGVIAKNVRAEISIDKVEGLSASNNNELYPKTPRQETESSLSRLTMLTPHNQLPSYDIKNMNTNSQYLFEWIVGDLQTKENSTSNTDIFLRTESDIKIKLKIYSDELSEPIHKEYSVSPTEETFEFDLNFLELPEPDFIREVNEKIMGGYLERHFQKQLKDYEFEKSELLPK